MIQYGGQSANGRNEDNRNFSANYDIPLNDGFGDATRSSLDDNNNNNDIDAAVRLVRAAQRRKSGSNENVGNYPYNQAAGRSCTPYGSSVPRTRNRKTPLNEKIVKTALAILAGMLIYTGAKTVQEKIVYSNHYSYVDHTLGNGNHTILQENTHRTDDYQNFWYDTGGIAEDILSKFDDAFDAALYVTYNDMGVNRNNGYISNIDFLIRSLNMYVNMDSHPITYAKISGCESFSDFLIKNGFIDKNGNPSYEMYESFGHDAVENCYTYLVSLQNKATSTEKYGPNDYLYQPTTTATNTENYYSIPVLGATMVDEDPNIGGR